MTTHWQKLQIGELTLYHPVTVTLRHWISPEHWVLSNVPDTEWGRLIMEGWKFVGIPGGHLVTYNKQLAEAGSIYFESGIAEV